MSDNGRQSMTESAANAMTPDSAKSTTQQMGDKMSGAMDSLAGSMQPNSQKSGSQRVSDSMTGKGTGNEDSMLNKAKNAVGMGNNTNMGSNSNN